MDSRLGSTVIIGRVERATGNALTLSLVDGTGEPVALARQGGDAGFAGRLAIGLGLRNHGPGRHLLRTREGDRLVAISGLDGPSSIERNGSTLATVQCGATVDCGDTTIVSDLSGAVLLTVEPDPARPSSSDVDRYIVRGSGGRPVARLDVLLARSGGDSVSADPGTPSARGLPLRILGTRLVLATAPSLQVPLSSGSFPAPTAARSRETRDLLLALCVDLALGGRAFAMASWPSLLS